LFLQAYVGVKVDLCGLDRFVSEPEGNYRAVDSILEKVHCRAMAKHMRADLLPLERCARSRGSAGVFGDETFDRIAAQLSASGTGKQRIFGPTVALAQPGVQHRCGFWTQRCAPVFSPFSLAVDMGASSQHDILAIQANQLGDPETGLNGEQKHCPITPPNPTGEIRCRQHSLTLFAGEKFDGPTFVTFRRHREDLLAKQRMRRLLEGDVLKKGMNRSQADVPRASAVFPTILKVVEEIAEKRGIQIFEREIRWRFAQPLFCKMKEQTERIAVPRYGVGTCAPLPNQAIGKERLQKRGKAGRHYDRASFPLANRRSVAN
jgi:hypothetical protein